MLYSLIVLSQRSQTYSFLHAYPPIRHSRWSAIHTQCKISNSVLNYPGGRASGLRKQEVDVRVESKADENKTLSREVWPVVNVKYANYSVSLMDVSKILFIFLLVAGALQRVRLTFPTPYL